MVTVMSPADPRLLAVAAAAATAALAVAQSPVESGEPTLRRPLPPARDTSNAVPTQVDPAVADRHSLSTSLRAMPVDLSPHGFERVYAVPGRDDLLMRSNGALYAVFSQSTYARDPKRGNLRVTLPPSTVFYIGRPNFALIRSTGVRDVSLVRDDSPSTGKGGTPLASVQGVRRIDSAPIDGRADHAGARRVDDPGTGRFRAVHEDGPAPGSDAAPKVAHGDRSPETAPPAAPAPDLRATRPGFAERIDELMRRARKAP